MLRMARDFDVLAKRAERRAKDDKARTVRHRTYWSPLRTRGDNLDGRREFPFPNDVVILIGNSAIANLLCECPDGNKWCRLAASMVRAMQRACPRVTYINCRRSK
jgi:hypothetical protein